MIRLAALALALALATQAEPARSQALPTPQPSPGAPLEPSAATEAGAATEEGATLPPPDFGDPLETAETLVGSGVVIRALDKLTGERAALELAIDVEGAFQRMRVVVRRCYARISARDTEATAFVQIFDTKNEPPARVFSGWMFSSSPALSALDHARYDFWVASCKTESTDASN